MAAESFTASLFATLQQTIAPDTQTIKAATVQLNNHFYTDAQCVPALFDIATSSQDLSIRQLALVELRKRVTAKKSKQWLKQTPEVRAAIKARLLEAVVAEQSGQSRAAATRLISALARIELGNGTWPELLPWLWSLASAQDSAQREVALQTIFMLLDTLVVTPSKPGGSLRNHVTQLLDLFNRTLADADSLNVRVWTVRSLGKLSEFIEQGETAEISAFQSLVPGIIGVLSQTLEANDEAAAKSGFEVLESLTLAETPLLNPHLPSLVQFLLSASANVNYDNDLRITVLNALLWIVKFKKGKIQSLNLAGPIVVGLLPIGAEPEPQDADDDVPARSAFRVIDALATSLPPAQVFPPLFEQVRQLAASPDAHMRKAAITAFGVVVEGCSLFIQPHLDSLWPLVEGALNDPEVVVRKAACNALGCLCEMLEEECAKQHAILLPIISRLMGDAETQRSACTALDCLLEVLGKDIEPYIPSLMQALVALLDTAPLSLKGTVVGAIGSAAHASKTAFAPYFEASMQRIVPFLSLTEEGEELQLRGVAQDTVGTLAEAVGKEMFRPYYEPLMRAALEALAVPNAPNLKECSYIFFAVMSRVYGEEYGQHLPTVMPILLAAVSQSEIDEATLFASSSNANDFATGVDSDDEDGDFEDLDEEIDSDEEEALFSASTAIAIEKECAADAIAEMFSNTRAPFVPYVEKSVEALLPGLTHHWHDGIRKSSVAALLGFVTTIHSMSDLPKWRKGAAGNELQGNLAQLAAAVLPPIFEMWAKEEERDVVNEICNSFSAALLAVGPGLIVPQYVEQMCTHLDELLRRQAPCQVDEDAEEDEPAPGLGDQSEYDAALIGAACDLVGTLASVLGADFAQLFPTFLPNMAQYYDLQRTTGDRSTAIGSLAEIVNGMESAVTPFTDQLFTLFLRALSDPEAEVRSNAAFAMGSLLWHTQADLSGQYLNVLSALHSFFVVARMLLKRPDVLPMDQVVPVFLQALPLRRDFAESEMTFNAVFSLFETNNPVARDHVDHLLGVFNQALASVQNGFYPSADGAQITEETKGRIVQLVQALRQSMPEQVQRAGLTV
ncbi:hypothetical protein OIV83_004096 [Microbotryomycetes sp. JL201]|nr:hypothetical protein OIV83_004096 [Microbotryomycetes sp. JL201]